MKILKMPLFLMLSLLLCFTTCKKVSPTVQTNTELLCKQGWTLISLRFNINNGPWTDGLASIPTCQKDNQTIFHSDFTYTLEEGATKCNSSDPQIFDEGTWSFSTDEKKLITSSNGFIFTDVDITLLNESNLQTIKRVTSGSDITIVETKYVR